MAKEEFKKILEAALAKKRLKQLNEKISSDLQSQVNVGEIENAVVERLSSAIEPVLQRLLEKDRVTTKEITDAVKNIQINVPEVSLPEIPAPVVNIPAPVVNVPAPIVNIPETKFPEFPQFPNEMSLRGVDNFKPLPVMLMDGKGKPAQFGSGGASGGRGDFFTIKGFETSAFSELTNPDGRLKVELPTGSSGLTDSELRATAVPVSQVSGASWSVSVTDVFGSTGANVINPDGRIKVELPTGSSGLTDTELRASSVPVAQASDAVWSTQLTIGGSPISTANPVPIQPPASGTLAVSATDLDIRDLANATDSVRAYQTSGASWSVEATQSGTWNIGTVTTLTGITNSTASALVDSTGVQYSGSNPLPVSAAQSGTWNIGTVTTVTGITNSVAVVNLDRDGNPRQAWLVSDITASVKSAIVDSTGVQYSGSNPVPVTIVTNSVASTIAVGDLASDAADTGSSPVKIGGIARTANPTAVAAGDRVSATYDDLGR